MTTGLPENLRGAPHIVVDTVLGVHDAWRAVTDWSRHADSIPLTTLTVTHPAHRRSPGEGDRLVATTRLGPVSVADTMEVTTWRPPTGEAAGLAVATKTGRHVIGAAAVLVEPLGDRARVTWFEDVRPGPALPGHSVLTRVTAPLNPPVTRFVFGRALRTMLRRAEVARQADAQR